MNNWIIGHQRREPILAMAILVVVAALAYGANLSGFGFYRDDWLMLWGGKNYGPELLADLMTRERPIRALLYVHTFSAFQDSALAWQLYSLLLKVVGAFLFLWLLRMIWPRHNFATTSMAVLFLLYPGFLQQPNAFTFSPNHFAVAIGILSFTLTLLAIQASKPITRIVLTILALATAVTYWMTYEYMIGLEAFRFGTIFIVTARQANGRWQFTIKRAFARSLPYVGLIVIFLIWHIYVRETARTISSLPDLLGQIAADPARNLMTLGLEWARDQVEIIALAWGVPIYSLTIQEGYREISSAIALASVSVAIILVYYMVGRKEGPAEPDDEVDKPSRWAGEAVILGGLTVALSSLPVLIAGRDVRWDSGFDRYSLHVSLGVSVLIVGLLHMFVRPRARLAVTLGLIGIAVATHYTNGVAWKQAWESQRALWWQLAWRAPALHDGTVLVARIPDYGFFEDYEIWGPANLIYDSESGSIEISAEIITEDTANKIRVGAQDLMSVRTLPPVSRDYGSTLLLTIPGGSSCLHVIDGSQSDIPSEFTSLMLSLSSFGSTSSIDVDAAPTVPPESVFGGEPEHDWCYYYQAAQLAKQRGNWGEVARLGDEALTLGLHAKDRAEWMPFLEAYLKTGQQEAAMKVAKMIQQREPIRHYLCDHLDRITLSDDAELEELDAILCDFS